MGSHHSSELSKDISKTSNITLNNLNISYLDRVRLSQQVLVHLQVQVGRLEKYHVKTYSRYVFSSLQVNWDSKLSEFIKLYKGCMIPIITWNICPCFPPIDQSLDCGWLVSKCSICFLFPGIRLGIDFSQYLHPHNCIKTNFALKYKNVFLWTGLCNFALLTSIKLGQSSSH